MLAMQPGGGRLAVPHFNLLKFPRGGAQQALAQEIHARTVKRMAGGGGNLGSPLAGVSVGSPLGTGTEIETPAGNWWEEGGTTGARQALQPLGAASYAASLLDLTGNGNHASEGVAPTWDASYGWGFDGISFYLNSNVIPDEGNFAIVRISNAVGSGIIFGARGNPRFYLWGNDSENGNYGDGAMFGTPHSFTSGVIGMGDNVEYYNGSALTGLTPVTWTGTLVDPIALGGLMRAGGVVTNFVNCKMQGYALYETEPSPVQYLAVSNALAAL